MKMFLKWVAAVVGVLAILFVTVPAVLPTSVHVERSATISKDPAAVYAFLMDFNKFSSWSPWYAYDPEAKITTEGQGVGATYAWVGEKSGEGKMTLVSAEDSKAINVKLEFFKPMTGEAMARWLIEPGAEGTKVTWTFEEQNLPYFRRFCGFLSNAMLGGDYEKGLAALKTALEKQ